MRRQLDTGHEADARRLRRRRALHRDPRWCRDRSSASVRRRRACARVPPAAAGASTPSEKWLWVWKSTRVSVLASIRGPYDTPRMSPQPAFPARLVGHRHRAASISTARCSTRPMTITSGATSCRNGLRWRNPWICTPLTPRSHGASRRAAARSTGIASSYWSRTLGIDIGALHREVRSHVAWLPGARDFLARMRGRRQAAVAADELASRSRSP